MITIYGWLEIRTTYLDEDLHSEIDEIKIMNEVNRLIQGLKYSELEMITKNYTNFIQFHVFENHRTEKTEEMVNLIKEIAQVATGSYGLMYYLDDEDDYHYDDFKIMVCKKGKCVWEKDKFFSPCSIMLEEDK